MIQLSSMKMISTFYILYTSAMKKRDILLYGQVTSFDSLIDSLENWRKTSLTFQSAVEAVKKMWGYITELEEQNKRLKKYRELAEKQNEELGKKNWDLNTQLNALLFTTSMKEALIRELTEKLEDLVSSK